MKTKLLAFNTWVKLESSWRKSEFLCHDKSLNIYLSEILVKIKQLSVTNIALASLKHQKKLLGLIKVAKRRHILEQNIK